MRKKTCKGCGERYEVQPDHRQFQNWCCHDCAVTIAIDRKKKAAVRKKVKDQKEDKKTFRELKESLKTAGQYIKEAQVKFNAYIRLRDDGKPCISCQRRHSGQYHAGHYRTTKAMPELRFNEDNCNLQCAPCNNHLSGNIIEYRKNLITKIGIERVEVLESHHELLKLTISDLKSIKDKYTRKTKELKNSL